MPRTCHHGSSLLFSSDNGRVRAASFVSGAPRSDLVGLLRAPDRDHAIDLWRPQIGFTIYIYSRARARARLSLFGEFTINREDRVAFSLAASREDL